MEQQPAFRVGPGVDPSFLVVTLHVVPAPEGHPMEQGGNAVLPPSALAGTATMLPLYFSVLTPTSRRFVVGVAEFTATEGQIVLPRWKMTVLNLKQGDTIQLEAANPPKGVVCTIRPRDIRFATQPLPLPQRAFCALPGYSCLNKGEAIAVQLGAETILADVVALTSNSNSNVDVVRITNSECVLEFDPPRVLHLTQEVTPCLPLDLTVILSASGDVIPMVFSPPSAFHPPTLSSTPNLSPTSKASPPRQRSPEPFTGTGRTPDGSPARSAQHQSQERTVVTYTVPVGGRVLGGIGIPSFKAETPSTAPRIDRGTTSGPTVKAVFRPFSGTGRRLR